MSNKKSLNIIFENGMKLNLFWYQKTPQFCGYSGKSNNSLINSDKVQS